MAHLVDNVRHEVIGKAPAFAQATRIVGEFASDEAGSSSGLALVDRFGVEVLAAGPIVMGVTRIVGEFTSGEVGTATSEITADRFSAEIIGSLTAEAAVTRVVGEMVLEEAGTGATVTMDRFASEILGARFLPANICPDPPELGFFAHNWAESLTVETTYDTSVGRSPVSVAEDRWIKRQRPSRTIKFRLTEEGDQGSNFRNTNLHQLLCILENSTEANYKVPLYSDQVCVTADEDNNVGSIPPKEFTIMADISQGRFYVGGQVVVVEVDHKGTPTGNFVYRTVLNKVSSNELLIEGELTWDVKANRAVIMPVFCSEPQLKFKISQHRCKLWQLDLEFEEVTGPEALPPIQDDLPPNFDTYRGVPILRPRHDYNQPLKIELVREGSVQTLGRGKSTYARGSEPRRVYPLRFVEDRAKTWDYIRFFDTRKGRARSFWFTDQSQTLQLVAADGVFVDFNPVGDFAKFLEQVQGGFIGFELKDGTCITREVVTVQEVLGVWRCTCAETTGFSNLDPALVVYAGRAFPSRFRKDTMTERWTRGTQACRFDLEVLTLLDENPYDLTP